MHLSPKTRSFFPLPFLGFLHTNRLAGLPQTPKSFSRHLRGSRHSPRRLRRLREAPGICRDVCAGCARFPAFAETFAQAARGSRHSPRRLRGSRKRQKVFRDTCSVPANTKKFFAALAALLQNLLQGQDASCFRRTHVSKRRKPSATEVIFGADSKR